jgi:hypothetical protein
MTETRSVTEYTLLEFCRTVETNIKEGFTFDYESNDNCPNRLGNLYVAVMTKEVVEAESKPVGRPKKPTAVEPEVKTNE